MSGRIRVAVAIGASLLMVPPVVWMATSRAPAPGDETAPEAGFASVARTSEPDPARDHRVPTPTPSPSVPAAPVAPAPVATATPSRTAPTGAAPAASAAPGGAPGGARSAPASCSREPIRPTGFQVPRMGVNAPMVTVGNDKDGNPGAPPLSQMFSTAWYRGSPAPGAERGNVIINVHSYAGGPALGNNLNAASGLRAGDVIKVTGAGGTVACYRFREKIKFSVASYDPRSGIYHNSRGRPQLAIMTCTDRNPRTGVYESRIIFYADRVV